MTSAPQSTFADWAVHAWPRLRRTAFLLSGDWHLADSEGDRAVGPTWQEAGLTPAAIGEALVATGALQR